MNDLIFDEIKNNWLKINANVKEAADKAHRDLNDIKIIAVSKTHPADIIQFGAKAGITNIGENYVQELTAKYEELKNSDFFKENVIKIPKIHFIGHLQSNKVKFIIDFVDTIHTVDSVGLASEIQKQCDKINRNIDILLQINTSGEESKSGCEPSEAGNLIENILNFDRLNIKGLMTIGTFSEDESVIRPEFQLLRNLRNKLQEQFPQLNLSELSMGMSHDYPIAIEEGATYVRIGTAIFGYRNYNK